MIRVTEKNNDKVKDDYFSYIVPNVPPYRSAILMKPDLLPVAVTVGQAEHAESRGAGAPARRHDGADVRRGGRRVGRHVWMDCASSLVS